MKYVVVSVKGQCVVSGTLDEAIQKAREMDDELQPAFGVQVTDENGDELFDTNYFPCAFCAGEGADEDGDECGHCGGSGEAGSY